jgi:MFS family permease
MSPAEGVSPKPDKPDRMTREELRGTLSLSSLFALRMLGLFIILPVFAIHAHQLPGGNSMTLVGVALGIYGLAQGLLQIPFGMASDRYGRKKVIVIGLLIFALGSFVAALDTNIWVVILGRTLQGAGAISSSVVAFVADLTREQHRTKAMAAIGGSIGLMFAVSLVAAPLLYPVIGMSGIFIVTGLLALAGIWVTLSLVPDEPRILDASRRMSRNALPEVLRNAELLKLNFGIFCLHIVQVAIFVVVPVMMVGAGLELPKHWQVYLPVVLLSFALMLPPIFSAERRGRMKVMFVSAVALMGSVQLGFYFCGEGILNITLLLLAFFVAFNLLEAALPSLVTRIAPAHARGTAIGVYNTTQALALAVGGFAGGALSQNFGPSSVFVFGSALVALWLGVAAGMRAPGDVRTRRFPLAEGCDPLTLREALVRIKGVRDAVVLPEKRVALLTFYPDRWDEQAAMDLIGRKI